MQTREKKLLKARLLIKIKTLYLLIIASLLSFTSTKQLKYVFEMFRHGARSPLKLNSELLDIFNQKWQAAGELTSVGMRQHFLLGFRNSEVYGKQLNITKYSPSEIFITATNYNRTILSAYSQLQGFFPPLSGPVLRAEQMLHAFPPIEYNFETELKLLAADALSAQSNVFAIKVINKGDHDFSLHDPSVCEGVKPKIAAARDSAKVKQFLEFFNKTYSQKLYKIINKTEQSYNLNNYDNVINLFDAFICGYTDGRNYTRDFAAQNLSVAEFLSVAKEFTHIGMFDVFISDDYTALMSMSPLFSKLLNNMEQRIQKDVNNITAYSNKYPKISMLSGHDTNLAAFMVFLRAVFPNRTELISPEFASSAYVELVLDEPVSADVPKDKYFVNVLVNDENIFNEAINYAYFSEQIKKKIIKDEEIALFCKFNANNTNSEDTLSKLLVVMVVIAGVFAAGLFVWFILIVVKRKKSLRGNDSDSLYRAVV